MGVREGAEVFGAIQQCLWSVSDKQGQDSLLLKTRGAGKEQRVKERWKEKSRNFEPHASIT